MLFNKKPAGWEFSALTTRLVLHNHDDVILVNNFFWIFEINQKSAKDQLCKIMYCNKSKITNYSNQTGTLMSPTMDSKVVTFRKFF